MPKFEVAAHCRYQISYHIVWIVKYRRMLLTSDPVVQRLVQLIYDIGKHYELPVEEIGTDGDHLHLFCRGIPSAAPARVVQIFKSISARKLMQEFPQLKQQTYGAGLWGVGYYLSTVGYNSYEGAIRAYVKNQGKQNPYVQLKLL